MLISPNKLEEFMGVKLEPETAFMCNKFVNLFSGIIFSLNAITFI